ncbi:hypothetical protein [Paraburkholderia azotifigens]|uniref:Uncharacterized protein n=1 Tax=Paraburkholderia azotifigens TaxID=2057004 RepID=A0A5C6VLX4_9BURK|nr:hypothetical protein [Paraburkholderia azotifigens]TXC85526.1 hypothetical protein FRZ40_17020 [Paraburkholderia azotifigens]
MELSEFITETLVQIQTGVRDEIAKQNALGVSGAINPVFGDEVHAEHLQKVEFDVAVTVTVTDKSNGGGKAGIKVFSIELGGELSKSAEQSTASRVKFAIPVVPPVEFLKRQ